MNRVQNLYLGKVEFEIVPTTSERGRNEPWEYRLGKGHGMILFSREGDVLWRKPGHQISREDIIQAIRKHTGIEPD